MKILQINVVNGILSTGRTVKEMADYLNDKGHVAYVARKEGKPYKYEYIISSLLGTKLHGLLSRIFGLQGYYSRYSTKQLIKYINFLKPDIVHLRNLHANFVNMKMLLGYLADNIPTVLTLHDCWFYTGKCCHYTNVICYKWKSGCNNCPQLKNDNISWFFDRTSKMWSDKKELFSQISRLAVVGVSDWITNEARQSLLSSAIVVKRIYNWIDLDLFVSTDADDLKHKLNLDGKFIILGIAASWGKRKSIDKFLELSKIMPENFHIVLVGKLEYEINVPFNITHIKRTDTVSELVKYYNLADIFLNFSLEETFGKVTAESLACGTPAIVINSTANPELVGEGCGYVAEKDFVMDDILKLINKIKSNGKKYYKDNCIKYARDNFDKAQRIDEYISLYQFLLDFSNKDKE